MKHHLRTLAYALPCALLLAFLCRDLGYGSQLFAIVSAFVLAPFVVPHD